MNVGSGLDLINAEVAQTWLGMIQDPDRASAVTSNILRRRKNHVTRNL